MKPPCPRLFQRNCKRAGGDNEHTGSDIIPARAQMKVLGTFKVSFRDTKEETHRQTVRDIRRAIERIKVYKISTGLFVQRNDLGKFFTDGMDYLPCRPQIVD